MADFETESTPIALFQLESGAEPLVKLESNPTIEVKVE